MAAFFDALPSHRGRVGTRGHSFRLQRSGITLWLVVVSNREGVRVARRVGTRSQCVDVVRAFNH